MDADFSDIWCLHLKALPFIILCFSCGWESEENTFCVNSSTSPLISFQQSEELLLHFSLSECPLCSASYYFAESPFLDLATLPLLKVSPKCWSLLRDPPLRRSENWGITLTATALVEEESGVTGEQGQHNWP